MSEDRNDDDSSDKSLAWETRSFIEQAWDNLNENGYRSVIEHDWDSLNETGTQMPRFEIPIRERRIIVSPQKQIQTPMIQAKPKVKRQICAIASLQDQALLGTSCLI